jgi:uncharacterized protein (DUF427 family)
LCCHTRALLGTGRKRRRDPPLDPADGILSEKRGRRKIIMKATWRGEVIAESDRTLEVGGYTYFPRTTVRMDLLQATPKTESDLECPHGVQFFDVATNGGRSERAAWSYEAPKPKMAQVDHWIGFWRDVELA